MLASCPVAVVRLVAVQDHGCGHLVEQGVGGGAIRHLAAGQQKGKRAAEAIAQRVDFRVRPPRERPIAWVSSPLYRLRRSDAL